MVKKVKQKYSRTDEVFFGSTRLIVLYQKLAQQDCFLEARSMLVHHAGEAVPGAGCRSVCVLLKKSSSFRLQTWEGY